MAGVGASTAGAILDLKRRRPWQLVVRYADEVENRRGDIRDGRGGIGCFQRTRAACGFHCQQRHRPHGDLVQGASRRSDALEGMVGA